MLPRDKRTFDSMVWDFPCGPVLTAGEILTGIVGFDALPADCGLVFGAGIVNTDYTGPYSDGTMGAPGQVGRVRISGGEIPPESDSLGLGVPNLLCHITMQFLTSQSPTQLEVEAELLLCNDLINGRAR